MNNAVSNLCRACLTSQESFTYYLFEDVSAETYSFCTSIQPKEDETLPRALCECCYLLLTKYAEFKRTCIESQTTLICCKTIKSEETQSTALTDINEDTTIENIVINDQTDLLKQEEITDFIKSQTTLICCKTMKKEETRSTALTNINEDTTIENIVINDQTDLLKQEEIADFIESQTTLICLKTIKTEKTQSTALRDINEDTTIENIVINDQTDLLKQEEIADFNEELLTPDDLTANISPKKKKKSKKHKKSNGTILEGKQPLSYSCDICSKTFKYSKRMESHRLGHFDIDLESDLHCLKCDKSFMTISGLRRHEESVHVGVRLSSVACKVCGRVCASKHSLRAHEKMHVAKRAQVVCHVCGKRVSSAITLMGHLETHKDDRERRHTCEHCGKKFFTNTILLSHIKRLHTGLRYICGVCNYPFTDKHNLSKHLLIHEGIKLYKCDICFKSYATNASLVEHKRIHSGERPFNCSFCPKSFLSKRRLMDHHRTHTGDKPHRCVVCEQRFTQRGTLNRHMKVHDPTK